MTCGNDPLCHCGLPALFLLVLGATGAYREHVSPQCFVHSVKAIRHTVGMGRRISVCRLDGSDVSRAVIGPFADAVAVR